MIEFYDSEFKKNIDFSRAINQRTEWRKKQEILRCFVKEEKKLSGSLMQLLEWTACDVFETFRIRVK